MEFRRLGQSGLQVSELSFGAWVTFGTQLDANDALELMSAAYDHAAQAHARVAQLCDEGDQGGKPVDLMLRMAEDVPATEGILRMAREEGADLIVVGSHGRSGLMRMVLGSIATKVVAQSLLPVLVAR